MPRPAFTGECASDSRKSPHGTAVAKRQVNLTQSEVKLQNRFRGQKIFASVRAMKSKSQWRDNALRRLAGWSVLFLYVAAFSPLGFGLTAALGSFDRNHQLSLRTSESGTQVVLHHRQVCATHCHDALARTLTFFAQPASATQPDHVLQFNSTDSVSAPGQIKLAPTAGDAPLAAVSLASILCVRRQSPTVRVPIDAPLDETGALFGLRSTLLLI